MVIISIKQQVLPYYTINSVCINTDCMLNNHFRIVYEWTKT